nr:immunoglobulin heavy chain junction region [Mus musculus]
CARSPFITPWYFDVW